MSLWQPLKWFIDVFNMVVNIEFFPGLTFGAISLGFLTIILIFRMIIFPLTGGSIGSSLDNISRKSRSYVNKDLPRKVDRSNSRRKE